MREIYQNAAKVVVWLGPESGDSNMAFQLLAEAHLTHFQIEDWLLQQWKVHGREKAWKAIYDLVSHDYWNRI